MLRSQTSLIAAVVGLALIVPVTANAALVEMDLVPGSGDKLLTGDTSTNLGWLDLTATQGLSVNQILGGAGGWIAQGFRYPTNAEVDQYFRNAGAASIGNFFTDANIPAAQSLLHLMGQTTGGSGNEIGLGFCGLNEIQAGMSSLATYQYAPINGAPQQARIYVINDLLSFSTAQSAFGSHLVRTVPAPAALPMIGLAGLAAARRRRATV